jgi:hypothetical protein
MSASRSIPRPPSPWIAAGAALAALAVAGGAAAQGGALFPEPFVVEHHLVQVDDDGTRFESEPVTDYYGGTWIVSVRGDGSRAIVDLARREITEVRPEQGTWWTVSFDRLAELRERLYLAENPHLSPAAATPAGEPGRAAAAARAAEPAELVIEELPVAGAVRDAARAAGAGPAAGGEAPGAARPEPSLRLRVVPADRAEDPRAGVEVWLDGRVRLRPAALEAIAAFETGVLAEPRAARRALEAGEESGAGRVSQASSARPSGGVGRQIAAARQHAAGAVAVRTVRTLGSARGGSAASRLEDVATRLERIDELPRELVAIPEGLRRVPHPLEAVVAFLEGDNERDRAMSGAAGGGR